MTRPSASPILSDRTGLSGRFEEIPPAGGFILWGRGVRARDADRLPFRNLIEDIITLVDRGPDAARPVPPGGPPLRWPPAGLEFEARAARGGPLFKRRAAVLVHTLFAYLIMRLGISVGGFVPKIYVQQVVENSDFRKYYDCLR